MAIGRAIGRASSRLIIRGKWVESLGGKLRKEK